MYKKALHWAIFIVLAVSAGNPLQDIECPSGYYPQTYGGMDVPQCNEIILQEYGWSIGETNIYFIFTEDGRRDFPNTETLLALGFEIDDVIPGGSGGHKIPQGPDIPNVNTDPGAFCEFKQQYFRDKPNPPSSPCQQTENAEVAGSERIMVGIIQIGPDIFVIMDGERRLVPNPDTLDALGINRGMIDNFGANEDFLLSIPKGRDIPDVNRDFDGFVQFKSEFDQKVAPYYSISVLTSQIPEPTPPPEQVTETLEEAQPNWFCKNLGMFCPLLAAPPNTTNTSCYPQCVEEARRQRGDLEKRKDLWAFNSSTAREILNLALGSPSFPYKGQLMTVRVRQTGEVAKTGDLVIWPKGCAGVTFSGGHIAYALSDQNGKELYVHDSNSDNKCTQMNRTVKVESCMKFVTLPFLADSIQATQGQSQTDDKCANATGWEAIKCMLPWYKK